MKRTYNIIFFCIFTGISWATILNGSFEIPDPNLTEWFIPPLYWNRSHNNSYRDCYVGLHREFAPTPQYDRNIEMVHWKIPAPYHGSKFVVLSTGDLGLASDPLITESTMWQTVTFQPGHRLSGAYYFGTCDFIQYNDYGKIYLQPVDPNSGLPEEIVLAYSDVLTVGDFKSTNQWVPFYYDFTEQTAGTYYLICTVRDMLDTIYKSYLAVDGLKVCTPLYEFGDINMDCSVDIQDLTILSEAWLSWCPDPNYIDGDPNTVATTPIPPGFIYDPNSIDPNCPCQMADINKDWTVDILDFTILTDNWLKKGY